MKSKNRKVQAFIRVLVGMFAAFVVTTQTSAQDAQDYLDLEAQEKAFDQAREHAKRLMAAIDIHSIQRSVACGQILIAEGDSWFEYPGSDIVRELERLGWDVKSSARRGDDLESMLYDDDQLRDVYSDMIKVLQMRPMTNYRGRDNCPIDENHGIPKAIILSAGGNEILGHALFLMLEHRKSSAYYVDDDEPNRPVYQSAVNDNIRSGTFERLTRTLIEYISTISNLCETIVQPYDIQCTNIPIFIHGYDYVQASGIGYKFIIKWAGPWIKPVFDAKQLIDNADINSIIQGLVDEYNDVLCFVAKAFRNRMSTTGHLSNPVYSINFRNRVKRWRDELHPHRRSHVSLAEVLTEHIQAFHGRTPESTRIKLPPHGGCM